MAKPDRSSQALGRARTSALAGHRMFLSKKCNGQNVCKPGTSRWRSMEIVIANPGIKYEDFLLKHGGVRRDVVDDLQRGNYDLR